jgi:hypothetical protein
MCAMSQPASTRPPRTAAGMVAALIVLVPIVVAWVVFRSADDKATPIQSVDWAAWVRSGRAEQLLSVYAPTKLPRGWRATSVNYAGGSDPKWHLGLLTDDGKYVGVEESRASTRDLAEQYVDQDAVRGKDVTVAGETWQTWTDAGGDYALVRAVPVGGKPYESVLVGGSADPAAVRSFVATLTAGQVHAAG